MKKSIIIIAFVFFSLAAIIFAEENQTFATEQVKCIFLNSNMQQKCYSYVDNQAFGCSGVENCLTDISGEIEKKLLWKSTCGGYAETTIDGQNEDITFTCPPIPIPTTTAPNPVPSITTSNPVPATTVPNPVPTATTGNPIPAATVPNPVPATTTGNPIPAATPNPVPTTAIPNPVPAATNPYPIAKQNPICGNAICEGAYEMTNCPMDCRIKCNQDSDCGQPIMKTTCNPPVPPAVKEYPSETCTFKIKYRCENPGSINSKCNMDNEKSCTPCPSGCRDGTCITGELIHEKITCIFKNSDKEEKCFIRGGSIAPEYAGKDFCMGKDNCILEYDGDKGRQITLKSSCGGFQYTTQDGNDETVSFECKTGETNLGEIKGQGFRFAYWQCYDGSESKREDITSCKPSELWQKYAAEFCKDKCYADKSKCGVNSFSISNECYSEITNPVPTTTPTPTENSAIPTVTPPVITNQPIPTTTISPPTATENMPTPEKEIGISIEPVLVCRDSCPADNKCYPFGYRKSGKFCSDQGQFIEQLVEETSCENNFECGSNVCVDGKCMSSGFIQKIINWFKNLFNFG